MSASPNEKGGTPPGEISKTLTYDEKSSDHEAAHSTEHLDLANNVTARIRNPLAGISKEQLRTQVDHFLADSGLKEHASAFHKGALVAQEPASFESMAELDEEDKVALRREAKNRWDLPRRLYLTIAIASVGAMVQGWDQTGSNAANLSFPQEFGIAAAKGTANWERDQWIVGFINSIPYLSAALLGVWLTKPCNDLVGRRGCIFISGILLFVSPLASAFTHNWPSLLGCRIIMGVGMGLKGSTSPVFATEHAPTRVRAGLTSLWQTWVAFGLFIGYSANAVVARTGAIAWRLQLGSAFIPAIPLILFIYMCPESPRWLMARGRYVEAYSAFRKHNHTDVQAARELYYAHSLMQVENELKGSNSWINRFQELFTIPRVRRATLAAFVTMLSQQLCGINIIAFYSATIFVQAGFTELQALYVSIGFGALSWVFTFGANYAIDRVGRRWLNLVMFPQMFWSLLAAALCFLIDESHKTARVGSIAFFIFLFAVFYAFSAGPVPFAYTAEVFPIAQREQGMSFGVATNLFFASILGLTLFRILGALGSIGTFGLYAGFNLVAWLLLFLFAPETKNRTLEELDQTFSVPTRVFMRYQVTKTLPYWFKRYVLWNKSATIEPLYQVDAHMAESVVRAAQ
ncbi:hypothetical protein BDZ90DRAFT_112448 [Jaminaea rosea]|uniref:Major facilitator superfamily (MFS) profile domain-containing protein n=1 Tax=Jaminaea rosea TaxID=1569628 RepID=A0A316V268_9BASI|nr:hypothetical protein BDZ90DRAFT_112448 [Jaminaea rosea]PWN29515.1 hypothetical protein BDZ90DRAFT_112448 [Jaminaea rosea]